MAYKRVMDDGSPRAPRPFAALAGARLSGSGLTGQGLTGRVLTGFVLTGVALGAFAGAARAQNPLDTPLPAWAVDTAAQMCAALRHPQPAVLQQLSSLIDLRVVNANLEITNAKTVRARFDSNAGLQLTVTSVEHGTPDQRMVLTGTAPVAGEIVEPVFRIVVRPSCEVASARALALDEDGSPRSIVRFTGPQMTLEGVEKLNPIVPDGTDPGGIRVVQIGTGIAYDRPEIASRLARDADGEILGYDFKDDDARPYDRDPLQPTLFARQRGTSVASLLLREAPEASLIPFRFALAGETLSRLPQEAAARGARIVMLPNSAGDAEHWQGFFEAAQQFPHILFVVSAGTQGRDIDNEPNYPASLRAPNFLSVTSVEEDGHFSRLGNWGARSVDVAVPAERVPILLASGDEGLGSGSEYAVARVAAMAARILEADPGLTGQAVKARILEAAEPLPGIAEAMTVYGWIADPTS